MSDSLSLILKTVLTPDSLRDFKKQIQTLQNTINANPLRLRVEVAQYRTELGETIRVLKHVKSQMDDFGESYKQLLQDVISLIDPNHISQLDKSLNEIRIVTIYSREEVEKLADSYHKLAKEIRDTASPDLYHQGLTDLGGMLSSLSGVFKSKIPGVVGAVVAGLTLAYSGYQIISEKTKRFMEEQQEAFQKLSNSIKTLNQEVTETSSQILQYDKLSSKLNKTTEEKEKLLEITQKLASSFGDAVVAVDAEGNATEIDIQYIKQLITAKKELLEAQNQEMASKYYSTGKEQYSEALTNKNRIKEIDEDLERHYKVIKNIENDNVYFSSQEKSSLIDGHRKDIEELFSERAKLVDQNLEIQSTLTQEAYAFDQTTDSVNKLSLSLINTLLKATLETGKGFAGFDNLLKVFRSDEGAKAFKELDKAMNEGVSASKAEEAIVNLSAVLSKYKVDAELSANITKIFNDSLHIKEVDSFKGDIEEINTSLEKYQKTLTKSSKAISSVQQAIDGYDKSGKFSLDTILQLAEEYEQLLPLLGDEKALREELSKIILQEQGNSKEAYTQALIHSQDYYKEKVLLDDNYRKSANGTLEKVFAEYKAKYDLDLKKYSSLAEAKLKVESALRMQLATLWRDYYDAQGKFLGKYETEINGQKAGLDNSLVGSYFVDSSGNLVKITEEMKTQRSNYFNAVYEAYEFFDEIARNGISGVDFSKFGLGDETFSSTDSPAQSLAGYYEALIRAINAQARLTEEKNETAQADIDSAKSNEDHALQLSKTNELLAGQEQHIKQLRIANSELKKEYSSFASTSGFDTSGWLDDQGEATVEYEKQYLAENKNVQESMSRIFELLQKLKKAWLDNDATIKNINTNLLETAKSLVEIQKATEDLNFKSISDDYSKSMDEFEDKIKRLDYVDMFINEDDLHAKANILRDKMTIILDQTASIQNKIKTIASMDISKSQKEDLFKQWSDDLDKSVEKYMSLQQALAANAQKRLNIIQDIERKIMDMIKQNYQEELNREDKLHNRKMNNLKEQKEIYDKIIRAKIQALENEKDTNDYNERVNKLQEERNQLQQQYDSLLLDNSYSSHLQRAELQKSIAEKDKELQQIIYEHGLDYRRKSLEEELSAFNESKDQEIESEEESYEHYKNTMTQKMADENLYFEARNKLSKESTQSLINDLMAYTDRFGEGMSLLGDNIKKNLIDNLRIAVKELSNIPTLLEQINSTTSSNSVLDSAIDTINSSPSYQEKRKIYGNDIDVENALAILGTKDFEPVYTTHPNPSQLTPRDILVGGPGVFSNWGELQKVNGLTILYGANREETKAAVLDWKKINGYEQGGVNTYAGLAALHGSPTNPEVILNTTHAAKLFTYVNNLPSPADLIKNFSRSRFQTIPLLASTSSGEVGDIKIMLNVEGNLDSSVLPEVKNALSSTADNLRKELNKMGIHASRRR